MKTLQTIVQIACVLALTVIVLPVYADVKPELPLWADGAPGALGKAPTDIPTITPYLPDDGKANGGALVVCPGGSYGRLAPDEGEDYAKWLNQYGITAFVLKYRLGPNYHHPAMLNDVARAMRTVRANAAQWNVDPKRIGIIGSSAGGHLAATILTHFDAGDAASSDPIERVSSRPDIGILCYAVITMGTNTHGGSRRNLLGANPSPDLINDLSNEKQVKDDTPTCFIWTTWEDNTVKMENSMMFASALRAHNIPFDLHVYQKGPHGIGLGKDATDPTKLHPWTHDLLYWLHEQGFVK